MVHTSDGGVTWTEQGPLAAQLRSIDFLDKSHGFIGGLNGTLYQTTDAGTTWTSINSLLPKVPIGFCGISHLGNKVYVVGRYEGATDFYYSPDGGTTWQYHDLSAVALGLVDVAFVSDSVGFISGTSRLGMLVPGPATILKTTDGGQTWRTVFIDGSANGWAWKIFPAAPGVLYVSLETDDGLYRVAKSTDNGESWHSQTVATNQPLGLSTISGIQGIGFLDANVGWVGGFFTGMFATTNGGDARGPLCPERVPISIGTAERGRRCSRPARRVCCGTTRGISDDGAAPRHLTAVEQPERRSDGQGDRHESVDARRRDAGAGPSGRGHP